MTFICLPILSLLFDRSMTSFGFDKDEQTLEILIIIQKFLNLGIFQL